MDKLDKALEQYYIVFKENYPLRRGMLHPTAKSRLIFVRLLFLHALIEFFPKVLSTLLTTGIDDMSIPFCDHLCLSVT